MSKKSSPVIDSISDIFMLPFIPAFLRLLEILLFLSEYNTGAPLKPHSG
jgi:hypothetical protein